MKRVKDGDIKIKLSDLKGLTPNFRIRFYTTNSNYYIEKTSIDLMWDEEDEETEYIKLNWSELQAIGRGVMNYNLMTYENDDDFDDGIYDHYYQRTTVYFIDTDIIIDDEQSDKTVSELIAEIDQKVDEEITRSTDKDEEHDDAIANLQEQIDNIDVDVDLSDYYTKAECDSNFANNLDYISFKASYQATMQNVDSRFSEDELRLNMIGQTITNMGITITNEQNSRQAGDTLLQNTIDENERVTSAALNDLESRKADKSNTYTKAEVDAAIASGGADLTNYYTKTESDAKYAIANNLSTVATSGSYNDLSDKPTIPTVPTNVSAFNNDAGYLTSHQPLSGYATETWVQQQGYAESSDLSTVATSGSYNDLSNKPTIPTVPTNVSAFTNDAGYLTQHQDISGKANTADLAMVATSGSYNDLSNKPTIPTVPTNVSSFTNDAGYLTQSSLSGYATQSDIADMATQTDLADYQPLLTAGTGITINNNVISATGGGGVAQVQTDWNQTDTTAVDYIKNKPTIPTVPTNVSAFTNDAGYLTSHQSLSGYATESWVSTNYYNKTYIDTTIGDIETLLSNI